MYFRHIIVIKIKPFFKSNHSFQDFSHCVAVPMATYLMRLSFFLHLVLIVFTSPVLVFHPFVTVCKSHHVCSVIILMDYCVIILPVCVLSVIVPVCLY